MLSRTEKETYPSTIIVNNTLNMYITIWTNKKEREKRNNNNNNNNNNNKTTIDGVTLNYSVKAGRAWMKEENG